MYQSDNVYLAQDVT